VGLLLAFGRRGLLGAWLDRQRHRARVHDSAVVLAETFVSAPFFGPGGIQRSAAWIENLHVVARTLGASPFRTFLRVGLRWRRPWSRERR